MKQHPDTVNPLAVSSIALAASDLELLGFFAASVSASLGQTVSKSAFVRALIRAYFRNGSQHDVEGLIMEEIIAGRVWGTEPAARKPARAAARTKAAQRTTGKVLPPHRPLKEVSKSGTSQKERAQPPTPSNVPPQRPAAKDSEDPRNRLHYTRLRHPEWQPGYRRDAGKD